jgi:hypothetical protein
MSLIKKQRLTAKNLAAKRANARKARGPVSLAGKARSAATNLRHGFYSQARDEAMIALGENPKEYAGLLKSLVQDLGPRGGLQSQLVLQMGQAFWRMRRAERIQDGLAVRRVRKGLEMEQLVIGPGFTHNYETYQRLLELAKALNAPDFNPSPEYIQSFVTSFGVTPPGEVQKLFPLLRAYAQAAKAPQNANENRGTEQTASTGEEQAKESARQDLSAALTATMFPYRRAIDAFMEKTDKLRSPENIAALMAPRGDNAMLMQRMEDSSLRQLWRLTRLFLMVKRAHSAAKAEERSLQPTISMKNQPVS